MRARAVEPKVDKLDIVGGDDVAIIIDDDSVRLASLESLVG